ncbi:hypothetical protein [Nesterenkonia sandarakina]|uniref:Uncharacterized protein n=1 Tax=Nesterenkonia sandarakina TaxID=272918 RepID=A0A7Z0E974_9MICC|nr:hypothetical protein [Nesterenkonia sandarakina]NYJ16754.1 hypothetical protein [Nesterenkonia sandarakina]
MIFSRAAQQFDEAAEHYEQAARRLGEIVEHGDDCLRAVFAGCEHLQWRSPAAQAFTALTFYHVEQCRRRQSRAAEMSVAARVIAADLREQAHLARLLALAVDAAEQTLPALAVEGPRAHLIHGARGASRSAKGFLDFVESCGGLPLAHLAAADR